MVKIERMVIHICRDIICRQLLWRCALIMSYGFRAWVTMVSLTSKISIAFFR
jgi:hypothetical protein